MEIYWYIIISIIVIIFFILDGYDFGVGIIHLLYAEKEKDKKVIAKAAGLFWDSNEVWLVVAGGLLFMAFPTFYASVFSGFYLPLIIVLWLMVFRAIGLELRGHIHTRIWQDMNDKAFGWASLLLALFFGIALGNIVRGVNLGGVNNGISQYEPHYFFLPLWDSSFSPSTQHPGVVDWFTLTIGIISVVVLTIHGANWIILKTQASINEKLKSVVFNLNIFLLVLTIFSISIWHLINPAPLKNFMHKPFLLFFPLLYFIGFIGLFFVKNFKNEAYGFLLSSLIIIGGISSSLASMFPKVLPSTNTLNPPLTIYNCSASSYGLSIAAQWGLLGLILAILYMLIQKRLLSGKIDHMDYGH